MAEEYFKNMRGGIFSIRDIVFKNMPVLHVTHDIDGDWQFLDLKDADEKEIVFVHSEHLLERDSTLKDVSDLPEGWHAWRSNIESKWERGLII